MELNGIVIVVLFVKCQFYGIYVLIHMQGKLFTPCSFCNMQNFAQDICYNIVISCCLTFTINLSCKIVYRCPRINKLITYDVMYALFNIFAICHFRNIEKSERERYCNLKVKHWKNVRKVRRENIVVRSRTEVVNLKIFVSIYVVTMVSMSFQLFTVHARYH